MTLRSLRALGLVIIVLLGGFAPGSSAQQRSQKQDSLVVFGQGFMFGVREPEGWHGDTERAAAFKVNILFYPAGRGGSPSRGAIRVGVYNKDDENTAEDLGADMDRYTKKFPDVRFEDFEASHGLYKTYSKLFRVEGKFHEYVAYVNPGKSFWYMFSVSFHTGKEPAGENELAAFREVVASLLAMGGQARPKARQTGFEEALRSAEANLASPKGKKYDTVFAKKAGPRLVKELAACTKGLPESDLRAFTVLVRVSASGKAEEVLMDPVTPVARCLRPFFLDVRGPKPPGPSWWVKMEIAITP